MKGTHILSEELHLLIQKYIPDDGSFESKLLSMEIGRTYDLIFIDLAQSIVNEKIRIND